MSDVGVLAVVGGGVHAAREAGWFLFLRREPALLIGSGPGLGRSGDVRLLGHDENLPARSLAQSP